LPASLVEEWFENLVEYRGRHALAGIADGKHDVGTGNDTDIGLRIGLVEHDVARFDRQSAAMRHGVSRVNRHVDQRVRQLQ
jgi:hypothetical protein